MLRKLLITTALCAPLLLAAEPAHAIPVAFIAASISGAVGVGFATTYAILSGAISLAGSLALSAISQRLARRSAPSQQEIKRELAQPQSRPIKRFVYGRTRVSGTPAPIRVKGANLYMCLILNSRPSEGNPVIYFDDREAAVVSGDMLDFTGPGATLEPVDSGQSFGGGADRPRVWLGLGDQIGPPLDILSELGGIVIQWGIPANSVLGSISSVALTINDQEYTWLRDAGGALVFEAEGDVAGFEIDVAASDPFAIQVTNSDSDLSFAVSVATCVEQSLSGNETVAALSISEQSERAFKSTDGWRGLTVLWLRIPAGPNDTRFDRWPRTPPVVEVVADWSKVWDPRDPAQDPDNPATWTYSNNQALCLLDAILHNPIKRRPRFLVDVDAFAAAADIADQPVARFYAGGTVPRYAANGILVWSAAELLDQITPLAEAGGGDLVQIGGQLSYAPPVTIAPDYTISDILEEGGFEFTRLVPGKDLPTAVRASYIAPDRGWQDSDLPALAVGAGSTQDVDDGILDLPLSFVTEATQGMRIQKIARNRIAAQRRLSCVLPPDAIDLTPGSVVAWGIAELPRCNGNWRVQAINPSAWLQGEGVALRCPVQLAEEPPNVDAWDPAVDEFELATEEYTPHAPVRVPPADLSATTGPGVALGDTPRIRFSFEPVVGNVVGYEWQWREVGGEYAEGGSISASVQDSLGRPFGFLVPVVPGVEYQIRVRTLYFGALSDFTAVTITAQGPAFELDPPSDGQAIGGAGQIEVSFLTPNNTAFEAIEFWGSDTNDAGAAVLLDTIASAANTVRTIIEGDLDPSVTRFYFARSRGPFGAVSAFTAGVSATTDP